MKKIIVLLFFVAFISLKFKAHAADRSSELNIMKLHRTLKMSEASRVEIDRAKTYGVELEASVALSRSMVEKDNVANVYLAFKSQKMNPKYLHKFITGNDLSFNVSAEIKLVKEMIDNQVPTHVVVARAINELKDKMNHDAMNVYAQLLYNKMSDRFIALPTKKTNFITLVSLLKERQVVDVRRINQKSDFEDTIQFAYEEFRVLPKKMGKTKRAPASLKASGADVFVGKSFKSKEEALKFVQKNFGSSNTESSFSYFPPKAFMDASHHDFGAVIVYDQNLKGSKGAILIDRNQNILGMFVN